MGDPRSSKREQLRPFGPVWDGAGIRGFAREGYWYHRCVPGLTKALARSTFVTKTITAYEHAGNMPLDASYRPLHWFPDCIEVNFRKGYVLNAVGLSGPGIRHVLLNTALIKIPEPFFISFMPILADDHSNAGWEMREFIHCLEKWLDDFRARHIGIQLNISCPNVGADLHDLLDKALTQLNQLAPLRLPVVVKLNLLVRPKIAAEIASHEACTGLCVANSVPYGTVLPPEWWAEHFPNGSPFAKRQYGNGGLSGEPIFPYVLEWLREFRDIDQDTYVNGGGGIMRAADVNELQAAGADSIFFSSVMLLRPWRVPGIIQRAHQLFG